MEYDHKALRHKNDPSWLRGLQPFVEKATDADVTDTIRNYGGNRKVLEDAAYDVKKEK